MSRAGAGADDRAAAALARAGRALVAAGLSPGSSGNVSVRVGDRLVVSPSGVSLGALDEVPPAVVGTGGRHLAGPAPSKEVPLHLALYRRDPSTRAVVHVHSRAALAAACLPPWSAASALAPYAPYLVMRVGNVPLVRYAAPGSARLAEAVAEVAVPFRAALLAHHGSIAVGVDLEAAVERISEVEEAARLALALHGTDAEPLPPDAVAELSARYGTPWVFAPVA